MVTTNSTTTYNLPLPAGQPADLICAREIDLRPLARKSNHADKKINRTNQTQQLSTNK
jgi:hypothetical protein